MSDLYSLTLALLDRFAMMHSVTKGTAIFIIDLIRAELLHKLIEND